MYIDNYRGYWGVKVEDGGASETHQECSHTRSVNGAGAGWRYSRSQSPNYSDKLTPVHDCKNSSDNEQSNDRESRHGSYPIHNHML